MKPYIKIERIKGTSMYYKYSLTREGMVNIIGDFDIDEDEALEIIKNTECIVDISGLATDYLGPFRDRNIHLEIIEDTALERLLYENAFIQISDNLYEACYIDTVIRGLITIRIDISSKEDYENTNSKHSQRRSRFRYMTREDINKNIKQAIREYFKTIEEEKWR